ncbi:hypothetical protein Ac2012v2_006166 [Leucoagaricus gongylophorus]
MIGCSDMDINRAHPTSDMTANKREFGNVGDKNFGAAGLKHLGLTSARPSPRTKRELNDPSSDRA